MKTIGKQIMKAILPKVCFFVSLACFLANPAWADVTLPAPEQLVTMSIKQRMALFQSMESLPPNQRDANLKALREEIDSLPQAQKQEMADRFRSEFQALPPDQQEALRQQLQADQPH